MAMPKKYDYAQICSDRGIKYIDEAGKRVVIEDTLGFIHFMQKTSLVRGSSPSIKSVQGDRTEYFKAVFNRKNLGKPLLFSFDGFQYSHALSYSTVRCLIHGEYKTKPNWLLNRGHHCEECSNDKTRKRLTYNTEKFIELASKTHGGKFCYSLSKYNGCRESIEIVCGVHGIFKQTPYLHLQGHGCPECGKLTGGYGASDYERVCPEGSNVYLMKIESDNEMFYKIGISKEPFKRSRDINRSSQYSSTVLRYSFHKDAKVIWRIEKDLHGLFSDFKYVPQNSFDGFTECFSFVCKDEFKELCKAYLQ